MEQNRLFSQTRWRLASWYGRDGFHSGNVVWGYKQLSMPTGKPKELGVAGTLHDSIENTH